jgi:hypothetical protein
LEELEETQAYINQAAALALKTLSAVLAGHVALANTNQEDVKEKKIPFAVLADHVTQAKNIYQQDAVDRRTPYAQVAQHALQESMYRERASEEITLFAHDALRHVPLDNSLLKLVQNLPMLYAANAVPAKLDNN